MAKSSFLAKATISMLQVMGDTASSVGVEESTFYSMIKGREDDQLLGVSTVINNYFDYHHTGEESC